MLTFISLDNLTIFFNSLNIDISILADFEVSVIYILSNIFVLLCLFFTIYLSLKIVYKLISFIF